MENIFKALREDHKKQRLLLDNLMETSGDTTTREDLFKQLKQELSQHAKFEERVFYKPLLDFDLTQERTRHSIAEHKGIDDKVEDLESTDYSSPGWLTQLKTLKGLVEHHLDEEEQEVFQLAGKALNEKQKIKMAHSYKTEMEELRS